LTRDPAVLAVARARRWAEWGDLATWYGGPPPLALVDAITDYQAGLDAGQIERIEDNGRSR